MASADPSSDDHLFTSRAIEVSVRIGLIALLGLWCLQIVRPFLQPIAWGVIIAIAADPLHRRLTRILGGRPRQAAGLLVVAGLLLLIGPIIALTSSLVETSSVLAGDLHQGALAFPPPPASVADWPIIGEKLHEYWSEASRNLEATLLRVEPQLIAIGRWLLSTGAATGVALLQFLISIVIAGALLVNQDRGSEVARGLATRLVGDRGVPLTELARATVQGVTRGILGVAALQALLAGIGMLAVGVPASGLWALLVLLLAVVQLPTLLVLAPVIVYVFSTSSTVAAALFAVWAVAVGASDTFLKPLLMGRGVDVPMLVIFLGAIGGFMLEGIIGLFVGAVVLAVGYTLFMAWLDQQRAEEARATELPAR